MLVEKERERDREREKSVSRGRESIERLEKECE